MDSFINLAQKGLSAYGQSQPSSNRDGDDNNGKAEGHQRDSPHHRGGEARDESYSKTGGQEYNSPHHRSGGENDSYYNEQEVIKKASSHSSEDSSVFSSALAHINSNPNKHNEPIDEEAATEAHRKIYKEKSTEGMTASSMGSAAALQILGQFTGGGGGDGSKAKSKTDLISLAMAEASKLFDSSGGSAHGNKQDAVNSAGLTIMKLFVQSKVGGGGAGSGGMGGLMSLASKFM